MVSRRLIAGLLLAATPAALAAMSLEAVTGEKLFERNWLAAPSSTHSDDGLGPLYDAPSCQACHQQRNSAPDNDGVLPGMVMRLGNARGTGDPVYGYQLQTRAVSGHVAEGNPSIAWSIGAGVRTPQVSVESLGYGPLASDTKLSLRRAPSLAGVSLLALVSESEILKRADPEDLDGDGIAGKPSWVVDENGKRALGRFGWKATEPNLTAQTQMAFSRDLGLSTQAHPEPWGDCTEAEHECRAGPHGAGPGETEVAPVLVSMIAKYLASLPPPPAPPVTQGKVLFDKAGCAACHATLSLADGRHVQAYTDLLLHDMGPGLNDGIKEGAADPGQWRTAPLWNVAQSLRAGGLLHDGRARSVAEAIEWHDGEAAAARGRFHALSAEDKAALAAFVSGL